MWPTRIESYKIKCEVGFRGERRKFVKEAHVAMRKAQG